MKRTCVLVSSPGAVINIQKLEEGFMLPHCSRVQFTVVEIPREQKLEVGGHIVSTVRKQRTMNTC